MAKCAHAKGSSSSVALTPTPVSGGLYGSFGFAPTRLNVADDPTRDKEIRESSGRRCLSRYHQPPCNTSILFTCPARWWGWYGGNFGEGGCILPCFDFCSCYHAAWTFHHLLFSPPLDLAHFVLLDCSPKDPEPENCGESSGTIIAVAPCSFSCSVIWMDCLYLQLTG